MAFFRQELAIDLGTANTVIFKDGQVILDEPGIIATDAKTGKLMAIGYKEIAMCIDKTVVKIENEILKVLQRTPPELYSNIVRNGVWLAGGGSLLRGIAKRFGDKVNITFHVAEDPLKAVARGTCLALSGIDRYPFLMR